MKNLLKNKLYNCLTSNSINIESDVFEYGYSLFCLYICYSLIIIPIAIINKLTIEVLFFIVFYLPLKKNIGGFHVKSSKLCVILSVLILILIPSIAVKITPIDLRVSFIIICVLIIITMLFKTKGHYNKILTKNEINKFTLRSVIVEVIYIFIAVILYNFQLYELYNLLMLTLIFSVLGILRITK